MIQHPLSSFTFCPRCGASGLEHVHGRAIHCPKCDLSYYHNVAAAVACFILDEFCNAPLREAVTKITLFRAYGLKCL